MRGGFFKPSASPFPGATLLADPGGTGSTCHPSKARTKGKQNSNWNVVGALGFSSAEFHAWYTENSDRFDHLAKVERSSTAMAEFETLIAEKKKQQR
jgi:hypothetical protein